MKRVALLRDNQLLMLTLGAAFGLIILDLAQAWLPEHSLNALRKVLRRLVKARLLHRYTLGDQGHYYVLSRQAVRLLDLPKRRVGPLGWPALIQATGVLGACVKAELDKLTAAEFANAFPELHSHRGMQTSYYALTQQNGLAWIVVDHGSSAFSVRKKIDKIVSQRYRVPAFRDLILNGALTIVIATATAQKAVDLESTFANDPPRYVRIQVVVVEQLISLMMQKGKP